jgi:hypothetical protein
MRADAASGTEGARKFPNEILPFIHWEVERKGREVRGAHPAGHRTDW